MTVLSCKTSEVASPNEFIGSQLVLTHGGGFAGTYTSYTLLDNGQLFKSSKKLDSISAVKGLEQQTTDQIFSNYTVLGFKGQKMESYGNLNYSITMIDKEGAEHKLIWERGQEGAEQMQLFYDNVMNQIRMMNQKTISDNPDSRR